MGLLGGFLKVLDLRLRRCLCLSPAPVAATETFRPIRATSPELPQTLLGKLRLRVRGVKRIAGFRRPEESPKLQVLMLRAIRYHRVVR